MATKKKTAITKRATTIGRRARSTAALTAVGGLSFRVLVDAIRQVHEHCAAQANRAVNREPDAAQLGDLRLRPSLRTEWPGPG